MVINLITADLEKLVIALRELDGRHNGAKPYQWGNPGRVSYNLARNLQQADRVYRRYLTDRAALVSKLIPDNVTEVPPELQIEFSRGMSALLETPVDLEVRQVRLSELNLELNAIPPATLAALLPLIFEDVQPESPPATTPTLSVVK